MKTHAAIVKTSCNTAIVNAAVLSEKDCVYYILDVGEQTGN